MINTTQKRLLFLNVLSVGIFFVFTATAFKNTQTVPYSLAGALEFCTNGSACIPVAIIGGGNAGLAAALYTAREHIKTLVMMGEQPG